MEKIDIIKLNIEGQEVWRYPGEIVCRMSDAILIEAFFDREYVIINGVLLTKGDRFLEKYYFDRYYNIFEVYDQKSGDLKCWYCNIASPINFVKEGIQYVDLALDLLVFPDGRYQVLDEDEFAALEMKEETRLLAQNALAELIGLFIGKNIDLLSEVWEKKFFSQNE